MLMTEEQVLQGDGEEAEEQVPSANRVGDKVKMVVQKEDGI